MYQCVECGTKINQLNIQQYDRTECPLCGIELELMKQRLMGLQLGPSEE
jgi:DNA-directed RNA polymerase subunit RPC12/RpoP